MTKPTPELRCPRFWSKVEIGPPDQCWPWVACRKKQRGSGPRYGRFHWHRKTQNAHRVAFILANGGINDSVCVLHKCDNHVCCNPRHLYAGSHKQNAQDRKQRIFWSAGARNPNAKLTESQVRDIRQMFTAGATYRDVREVYDISDGALCTIKSRKSWKNL